MCAAQRHVCVCVCVEEHACVCLCLCLLSTYYVLNSSSNFLLTLTVCNRYHCSPDQTEEQRGLTVARPSWKVAWELLAGAEGLRKGL